MTRSPNPKAGVSPVYPLAVSRHVVVLDEHAYLEVTAKVIATEPTAQSNPNLTVFCDSVAAHGKAIASGLLHALAASDEEVEKLVTDLLEAVSASKKRCDFLLDKKQ